MHEATLVFPHQLFKQHPAVRPGVSIWLLEETLFFTQYRFHQQKILLHRASMKNYLHYLQQQKHRCHYINATDELSDVRKLLVALSQKGITQLHYADTADNWLENRLKKQARELGMTLRRYPSPCFLNSREEADAFFSERQQYFQTDFYIAQRKQRNILLEKHGQPLGGKWSFDTENRKRFPKTATIPLLPAIPSNEFVREAKAYVHKNFSDHYGKTEGFNYPVNFRDADQWLDNFLAERFCKFGVYEDAIVSNAHYLYHSVLTPALNTGLLQPQQVLDKALDAAIAYDVPLNSLEGFVRQIMGWREFIHIVYEREGSRQRTTNYWGFRRKIPGSFWTGNTGILPVDQTIRKILATGYCHHIERLMVLGNFMLLCEFDPDEVYRWFMELFIDSYDWVMVPNVYGMTQFADGGLMTTKPYISGSNYLLKMGDYEKGPWQEVWDGLFWRFMHVHRDFFLQNPRLGMLVKTFDKMDKKKQQQHLLRAENFLQSL